MRVQTSLGEAIILVRFSPPNPATRRSAEVVISLGPPYRDFAAIAYCSEKDNFSRSRGRKLALWRLLRMWGSNFTHEDREKLWRAVCPEYFKRELKAED